MLVLSRPFLFKKHKEYTVGVLLFVGVFLALAKVSLLIMVSVFEASPFGDEQAANNKVARQPKVIYFISAQQ